MSPQPQDLRVVPPPGDDVSYWTLLRNRNYLRFFLAQAVSSLGDWVGVIAIAVFAKDIGGNTAVGAVMIARVLPGFVAGPIGGVLADRWDRKKTMVVADLMRAGVIFSLPFVPHLWFLMAASVLLESLTLIWGPAKDASLPHFVPASQLTHANSLSLIAVYGPWPLATLVFAFLAAMGGFIGDNVPVLRGLDESPEALALWVDSLTFVFSAVMVSTLTIASSRRRVARLDLSEAKRDLLEGLRFVRDDHRVRPWLLGIAFTFTAAGGVVSLGVGFAEDVLHAPPETGFAFLIGSLASGMITGLLLAGFLVKRIQKDVLFSSSILLAGTSLIAFGSMSSFNPAVPILSALGFFGGVAYSTGYALVQEHTEDALRGRTFSAAYTLIRIGTLIGLGLFPFLAAAIGDHTVPSPFGGDISLPGIRSTLWIAGLVAIGGGFLSMRAIGARGLAAAVKASPQRGYFVAFEGGEGAGKTTQLEAFVKWLEARGAEVVTTREPGGSAIGERIRDILLDTAADRMDERTEALLYAADRAQHVAEVIRPALAADKVVVSDRYIDSSLAYQGLARGLGIDEIYRISEWATGGLLPDLVLYLKVDPGAGLRRVGEPDRIESEGSDFHDRVETAYLELARRYPKRFVVIDAGGSQAEVHQAIVDAFETHQKIEDTGVELFPGLSSPPGPPVPR